MNAEFYDKRKALASKFSPEQLKESLWLLSRRTTQLDDLNEQELDKIYNILMPAVSTISLLERALENEKLKEKRAVILKIATEIGLKEPNGWERFNDFMIKHSILKKPLNAYNLEELKILERQFRGARSNFDKSAQNNLLNKAHQKKFGQMGFSDN